MITFKKYLLIVFATILPYSILALPDNIYAAESTGELLRVSPYIFTIRLSPGSIQEYEFSINNLKDFPVPLQIVTEDFVIADETGIYDFTNNTENSLVSWIQISEEDMILAPDSETVINFTVSIPSRVPFGGYHGMIFLEPKSALQDSNSSLLSTRIGIPVIASVGSTAYQINPLRILDQKFPHFITSPDQLNYRLRIQNNSLFHTTVKPILVLNPLWGNSTKLFLDEKLLFPGKIRSWENNIREEISLVPNIYQTTLQLPTGNGNSISTTSYLVFVPKTLLVIAAIILLILVIYVLHRQKKIHLGRFIRILFKG